MLNATISYKLLTQVERVASRKKTTKSRAVEELLQAGLDSTKERKENEERRAS